MLHIGVDIKCDVSHLCDLGGWYRFIKVLGFHVSSSRFLVLILWTCLDIWKWSLCIQYVCTVQLDFTI